MRTPPSVKGLFRFKSERGRRGGTPYLPGPHFGGPSRPAQPGFRLCICPLFPLRRSPFKTGPKQSGAACAGGRSLPAPGKVPPSGTLDGEGPFHVVVPQGKGASNSLRRRLIFCFALPSTVCFAVPLRSPLFCRPLRPLSLPPGFHTHSDHPPFGRWGLLSESGAG
jgi:hypothetical protein